MKTLLNILVLAALATAAAWADIGDIVINFDNPNQTGSPGAVLKFSGTILNNGTDTVFLNGDSLNFAGGHSFTVTDLLAHVPISLDAGNNSGDIELFDVTVSDPISSLDGPGTYRGYYNLLGGGDGSAQEVLDLAVDFEVTLPRVSVPEPSAMSLLGAELAALLVGLGMACRLRRRRSA